MESPDSKNKKEIGLLWKKFAGLRFTKNRGGGNIHIGKNVSINDGALLNATQSTIHIGDGCVISSDAKVLAATLCPSGYLYHGNRKHISGNIVIGDHVWICAGAIILPNVTVASSNIIAAGAVVTKDIKDNFVIVAGNPAKVIKKVIKMPENEG